MTKVFRNGGLVEWWDESTRTYSLYDDDGGLVESRPFTAEENAAADAILAQAAEGATESTIREQAQGALETNRAFLALSSPTNAQVLAQVRALTQQNIRLIRLALRQFDAVD